MADATNLSVFGQESYFNENVKFFKDIYVYGNLYYEFENKPLEKFGNIDVDGNSTFNGPVTFGSSVTFNQIPNFDNLLVGILTVTQRLDVGENGSTLRANVNTGNIGIGSTNPQQKLDVLGNVYVSNKVGIGSLNPEQKLDISGSVKINNNIYDSLNSSGALGAFLTKDAQGIKWTTFQPSFTEGIFVYNDGVLVGVNSFRGLNLITGRGAGVNTDPVQASINPSSSSIADVKLFDYWDFVDGTTNIYRNSKVGINNSNPSATLDVTGSANITQTLDVTGATTLKSTLNVQQATDLDSTLNVDGATTLQTTLNVKQATDLDSSLNVDGTSVFQNTVELNSSLIDINNSTATGKFDYRLSSVGTGVSWRPAGVQTKRAIWVTMDGNDVNSGLLEGDAKRTVGAAASIAQEGDTIFVRSGVYYENNPIGLRTDVSVSGQDLRLVTIIPQNKQKDVFHVRRGCLIENLSFTCESVSIANTGGSAVAFPPTNPSNYAVSGYIASGPATEGSTGRWKSPYVRNCTNFMTKSIGMKIDGNHATASTIGADLKSMVCDSFTQYNENGIGVSITNNGYAQLVSIFTINCDIGIFCASGGSCDLTNSNSSFGNYGLYAVGLGSTEFTGKVGTYPPTRTQSGVDAGSDVVNFTNMKDISNNPRRPYDGQALFFKIDLSNYPDAITTGLPSTILQSPMVSVDSIKVTNGGSGYSAANPPTVIIRDTDLTQQPKGPQGIIAEVSPTVDPVTGAITAIDVVNSGRNYLPTQNLQVFIDGTGGATAQVITQPIYYTVDVATEPTASGITTVTFNEFIPFELFGNEDVSLRRISRILTSSHSFEYIGTGIDINTSTPFKGAIPIKDNEVVALDGAQVPFTSTDQKGNFDIGEGFQINQPTSTIRGRDFSKAIQAEVTPLILALR